MYERTLRQALARLAQHVGRRIESGYFGIRIAPDQKLSGIARATTEIENEPRISQRHLRQQISRRARALVFEFQVLPRIPIFHDLWFAPSVSPRMRQSLGGGRVRGHPGCS